MMVFPGAICEVSPLVPGVLPAATCELNSFVSGASEGLAGPPQLNALVPGAPCELNPLVQGPRYSADSSNLDFLLAMLYRMPPAN